MRYPAGRKGGLGDKSNAWVGDRAGYSAVHMWLTQHYIKESCDHCNKPLEELSRLEWANISGEYRRDREDYLCLCPSCHKKMDLYSSTCSNGHTRIGNTRINNRGHQVCVICATNAHKRYMMSKALADIKRRNVSEITTSST
ncbi:hypothetical protein KAU11_12155 [Candidatus Babeliales bacterium]|nr:hypothetical protein [Candidatus Babeliales bacterium]